MIGLVFPILMLNLHVIQPRALLRLRTPLSSTIFRQQSRLWLKTYISSCGRVERRYTSTSSTTDPIAALAPSQPPPKSWVERTPQKLRPYLYLARIDKPIGTLLLYYPCGTSPLRPRPESWSRDERVGGSLVNNDGFVRAQSPGDHSFNVPEPLRGRRARHAECGVYDQ